MLASLVSSMSVRIEEEIAQFEITAWHLPLSLPLSPSDIVVVLMTSGITRTTRTVKNYNACQLLFSFSFAWFCFDFVGFCNFVSTFLPIPQMCRFLFCSSYNFNLNNQSHYSPYSMSLKLLE